MTNAKRVLKKRNIIKNYFKEKKITKEHETKRKKIIIKKRKQMKKEKPKYFKKLGS